MYTRIHTVLYMYMDWTLSGSEDEHVGHLREKLLHQRRLVVQRCLGLHDFAEASGYRVFGFRFSVNSPRALDVSLDLDPINPALMSKNENRMNNRSAGVQERPTLVRCLLQG